MATDNPEYFAHIRKRIEAIAEATEGTACLSLDNSRFDVPAKRGWNLLMDTIRSKRPNHFLMVNAGWASDDLAWIAPKINGIKYEDSVNHPKDKGQEQFYSRVAKHDRLLRKPVLSIDEVFGKRGDEESPWKELYRTLVYTDAAYLFSGSTFGR